MAHDMHETTRRTRARSGRSIWRGPLPIAAGIVAAAVLLAGWRLAMGSEKPSRGTKVDPAPKRFVDVEGAVAPLYLYGRATADGLLVAGDSRIGSDISIRVLERRGVGTVGTLWNGLAQIEHVLAGARTLPTRRLVVCLTPASVYSTPLKHMADILAKERATRIPQRIDERLDDELDVLRQRMFWTLEPNPWGGGEAGVRIQPQRHEGIYRALLAESSRAERRRHFDVVHATLRDMIGAGWRIACVRLPATARMEAIEDEGFPPELIRNMCADLGVPYLDMTGGEYDTFDGSHLLGADAERASNLIADWLLTLPRMQAR